MNTGKYIRDLRLKHGFSQEELGKLVGVQRAAVQKWECGKVQNLKRETIKRLSEIFNVPASSFIDSDENTAEDNELTEYLEELRTRSEMRMLFSVAKGATKEDVEKVVEMFKIMKGEYNG